MPKKSRKNVGLIGLGIIGSRVANALRQGGFHVYVWNRTPRAAPNFLASPRQIAELCDIIQIFVSDAQALFDVIENMGDALTPSHIILCNATVGPEATLDAARIVQDRGAQFLDAPFTGSKAAAQNRELVYYIGGEDNTLHNVESVLRASSKAIVKIGKIGDAAVIKLATNMISAVTVQTLAEAYAIVKGSGIDPKALAEALKQHAVRSGVTDAKLAKMLDRDYDPHFSLKHMFKDVQLGIHIANSLDIDLPATTSTAGVMYGGLTRGWADEDFAVLARNYQKEDLPPPLYVPPKPSLETAQPVLTEGPRPEAPVILAPAPVAKKEPPRDPTPDELRDIGVRLPEPPPAPEPPKPAPSTIEPVKAEPLKPEPVKPEQIKPDPAKVEPAKVEPAKVEPVKPGPVKAEPMPPEPVKAEPAKAAEPQKKPAEEAKTPPPNEPAPTDASRPHTFVRIRRWFGTGTPS
jgi:3-hydroxyisobutyrate dehydrogenase-like beta-hydroxyacid dehydrogenase